MTSWNPGDQQSGQPGYGQQPGQQPPPPNFDKGTTPPPAAPPAYGAPAPQPPAYGAPAPQPPAYGQQPPSYGQQPPAYGGGAGYAAPPTSQYGNNPYGDAAAGGQPAGTLPLNMGNRVIAFVIDAIVPVILVVVVLIIQFAAIAGAASTCGFTYDSAGNPTDYNCTAGAGAGIGIILLDVVLWLALVAFGIYQIFRTGKSGQTIGKKVMGVKVIDNDNGQTIGFGRAFLRYIVQGLSNIVCYAGLWSAWLDGPPAGKYRAWHDKAVNTVVVSVPK